MRREISLGGLYKLLNINLTLRGGGGLAGDIWRMTSCHIHSQELLLLALPPVLLATGILNDDKFSLRLGEGGSCVNIIMMLSMTLTPL